MASSSSCLVRLAGLAAILASWSAAAADIDAGSSSSSPDLQAGGFVIVAPKYDGSKEYEVTGLPIIVPSGYGIGDDGLIQLRGPDDLRLRAFQLNGFEAGPLVGWHFDRDQNDSAELRGLGDVDGGFVVGGYAAYRTDPFMPFISYHQQVSGDDAREVSFVSVWRRRHRWVPACRSRRRPGRAMPIKTIWTPTFP